MTAPTEEATRLEDPEDSAQLLDRHLNLEEIALFISGAATGLVGAYLATGGLLG